MKNFLLTLLQYFKSIDSLFWGLLTLFNLIFVGYLLHVGFYNRPASDDFHTLYVAHSQGVIKGTIGIYHKWMGRVAPFALSLFIFSLHDKGVALGWFSAILVVGYLVVFYSLASKLFASYLAVIQSVSFRWLITFNMATFLFVFLLLNVYSFSSFFWVAASVNYFWGLLAALVVCRLLLNSKFQFVESCFLLPICAFYAACSSENFAAVWLLILTLLLVLVMITKRNNTKDKIIILSFFKKLSRKHPFHLFIAAKTYYKLLAAIATKINTYNLIITWIISILSFTMMITAPGNAIRRSHFAVMDLSALLWQIRKNVPYFFGQVFTSNFATLIPIVFILLYIGVYFREKNNKNYLKLTKYQKPFFTTSQLSYFLFLFVPLFFLLLSISALPAIYATSGVGPLRSLTFVAFFVVLFVYFIAFFIGYQGFFPKSLAFVLFFYTLLGLLYLAKYKWVNELAGVKQYAKEYDARIAYLQKLQQQGNKKPIKLTPLTLPPGTLLFEELATDSLKNRIFTKAYHLDFDVYVAW